VTVALVLASLLPASVNAELDAVKIALLVDGMAIRGSSFDAAELYALGPAGLSAVLDHLLPDSAAPPPPPSGPPEDEIRRLIAELDADDFATREAATAELIAKARGRRALVEAAAHSDALEVRMRIERVLASWESRPAARLSAYLSGFWKYVEGLSDPASLELLARRTVKVLEAGMPESDRLHLVRLCIAGVAHGRDHASCEVLRPLVRHADSRVAALVAETVGAYKTDPQFLPALLIDALHSDQKNVVEAGLRFVLGCQDERRRPAVERALRKIFAGPDAALKFQACLPLMRDFHDPEAWLYVLEQTASPDAARVRTALNWIGDSRHSGQPLDARLVKALPAHLSARDPVQRRAAAMALATFSGETAVRLLVRLLADEEETVVRAADAGLLAQPDRALVRRILSEAAAGPHELARTRARTLLAKIESS
jgi:hypothetical protein